MATRKNPRRIIYITAGLLVFVLGAQPGLPQDSSALVGELTKQLSITPAQASGGAGTLFNLAKSRLSPADFGKVSASVPGIDGLMKSAPAASTANAIPGVPNAGGLGGLASAAGSFQKLGMSPDMVGKFVPVLTKFVEAKGGTGVSSLLAGALK